MRAEAQCVKSEFFKINLAKTRCRPQVVEPAMAVKDRIRVAKGRFLIPGSIKKIVLRDTSCIVLEGEKIFQSWHGVKLEAGYRCEVFLKLFLGRSFFKFRFCFY